VQLPVLIWGMGGNVIKRYRFVVTLNIICESWKKN